MTKKFLWWLFAALCILISLYPISYFVQERTFGLLSFKSEPLLSNIFWNIGFYAHIILGGVALAVGWSQFSEKLRVKNIKLHRRLGKIYVLSVLMSGSGAVVISWSATGGYVSTAGFFSLAVIWLVTTYLAYTSIKKKDIQTHQKMMIFSYAACFSAVTLRLWLPILTISLGDFIPAYRVVAWLCWVPNILVAYFLVNRKAQLA